MVQNTGSDPQRANLAAELASIGRLSDRDLIRLIERAADELDQENLQSHAIDFWVEVIGLLSVERDRRRQEILELERMYFHQ
jgi:hypothetical protein